MTYTILSAQYANADNSAVVVQTAEAAAVVATASHTPALWAQLSGVQVAAYVPPSNVPQAVTRFQAKAALLAAGLLPTVEAAIAQADSVAQLAWNDALEFQRQSPTILALAASLNLTSQQLDDLFIAAASITA